MGVFCDEDRNESLPVVGVVTQPPLSMVALAARIDSAAWIDIRIFSTMIPFPGRDV